MGGGVWSRSDGRCIAWSLEIKSHGKGEHGVYGAGQMVGAELGV